MRARFESVRIKGIATIVPPKVIDIDSELHSIYKGDEKALARIKKVIGLQTRHIAEPHITASDMGETAARRILHATHTQPSEIDALIVVTQTPDYILPATACYLHGKLGLATTCLSFDINQACAGYLYGLYVAHSLIESRAARKVLLIVGDTLSRYVNPLDSNLAPIIGDGVSATILESMHGKGHCALPPLNSSLGNHSQDCGDLEAVITHKVTPTPKPPQNLQSLAANTRIVCGEILESKAQAESSPIESKANSESSLTDSKSVSESHAFSESTLSDSHSFSESTASVIASERKLAKQSIKTDSKKWDLESATDSEKLDCHADKSARNDDKTQSATDSESKKLANRDTSDFCPQYDKGLESNPHASLKSLADSSSNDEGRGFVAGLYQNDILDSTILESTLESSPATPQGKRHKAAFFELGTQGEKFYQLIIPEGASRIPTREIITESKVWETSQTRTLKELYMDGAEIFNFAVMQYPKTFEAILDFSGECKEGLDYCFFHQANKYIVDNITRALGLEKGKVPNTTTSKYGNLSGCSVPATICDTLGGIEARERGDLRVHLAGFGAGLAWGNAILSIDKECVIERVGIYEG